VNAEYKSPRELVTTQRRAQFPIQPKLLFDPQRPGRCELGESARRDTEKGL